MNLDTGGDMKKSHAMIYVSLDSILEIKPF